MNTVYYREFKLHPRSQSATINGKELKGITHFEVRAPMVDGQLIGGNALLLRFNTGETIVFVREGDDAQKILSACGWGE